MMALPITCMKKDIFSWIDVIYVAIVIVHCHRVLVEGLFHQNPI